MVNHPLHKTIGDLITQNMPGHCQVIRDPACGGNRHIPFYSSPEKSRKATYCNADMVILEKGQIKVIIEIEESDVKPLHVIGKFFASALSPYYFDRSKNGISELKGNVLFVQVLDISKIKKGKSVKISQCENIEKSITKIIPNLGLHINEYKMYIGNENDFLGYEGKQLINCLRSHLK